MTGPTWLQGTAVAEMGSHGKPKAVQGFVTEISLKKFSERLLAERLEEALETKLAADRFIDMVSSCNAQLTDVMLTGLDLTRNAQPPKRNIAVCRRHTNDARDFWNVNFG